MRRRPWYHRLALAVSGAVALLAAVAGRADDAPAGTDFFERKIRPLLVERCHGCHAKGAKRLEAALALDSRAGILKGGENGPVIVAGKPDDSPLIQAVGYAGDTQMPPSGKLPAEEIALLTEWVRRGAPLPEDGSVQQSRAGIDYAAGRKFWSFQPPARHAPPPVQHADWLRRPIDAFLLAELERHGLEPSPRADARTLIRRAAFDLVGLPPSAEEVEQFASEQASDADGADEAFARLVERLLDSPHYGERWGRYWLDMSRYADGNTLSEEVRKHAWRYRDWVVGALNDDLPYDEFVRRQLAADLLPGSTPEDRIALGFLGVGPSYFKELKLAPAMIKTIVADELEERMDAVGRTFLGLTLACARCHDHKFDPLSVADYYALAGVLANTRQVDRFVIPDPLARLVQQAQQQAHALEEQIKKLKAAKPETAEEKAKKAQEIAALQEQIKTIEHDTPHYQTAMAHGVDDAALNVLADGPARTRLEYKPGEAADLQIHVRGNPNKLGPAVPRRFLAVLSPGEPQRFTHGSGRLELAEAIVHEGAPLSARVIVNRVWQHHFGRGLVETASDFGAQGTRPSHPELLDDLTCRFIEHGWSLKWLHREIMLSAAYQQSSGHNASQYAIDPDNRWLWRMSRRRLDIEAWRDAMLAVAGKLDLTLGGPPVPLGDVAQRRRTLYGRIDRSEPDTLLRLYDFPDPSSHSPDRPPTTTALQQLFVLNGPFVLAQAKSLAERIAAENPADAQAQVRAAYRLVLARRPAAEELQLGVDFLGRGERAGTASGVLLQRYTQALLASNEFLFVD